MSDAKGLTSEAMLELLAERHPEAELAFTPTPAKGRQDPTLEVGRAHLSDVAKTLRDDPRLKFDFLMSVSAVDHPPDVIDVVIHLFSYTHRTTLAVRCRADRHDARVPSVEPIWPAAGWHEREQYDLLGVVFEGNGDLRRIMLPDDWEGHPLRKDYVKPDRYHGIDNARPKNG